MLEKRIRMRWSGDVKVDRIDRTDRQKEKGQVLPGKKPMIYHGNDWESCIIAISMRGWCIR